MATKTMLLRIEVDSATATKSLSNVDKQIDAVGKDAKKAANNIDGLGDAFKDMSDTATFGLEEVTQQIGVGGESAKKFGESLVGAFKSAKLGANQFKTALVSLGIGALMIAIDLIIQNWSTIIGFFDGSTAAAKKFADEMDRINVSLGLLGVSEALAANKLDELNRVVNDGNKSFEERKKAINDIRTEESFLNAERMSAVKLEQAAIATRLQSNLSEEEKVELQKRGQQLAIELIKLEGDRQKIANRSIDSQKTLEAGEIQRMQAAKAAAESAKALKASEAKAAKEAAEAQMKADAEARVKKALMRVEEQAEAEAFEQAEIDAFNASIDRQIEYNAKKRQLDLEEQAEEDRLRKEREEKENRDAERRIAFEQSVAEAKKQLNQDVISAAIELTDAFGVQTGKNAKASFNLSKALGVAQATISGIEAVQNAFKTAAGSPFGKVNPAYAFIQAGLAAVFAAAKVKAIASKQFNPGGGGAGGASINAGGGGGGAPTVPNVSVVGGGINATGQLAQNVNDFSRTPVRAFVVSQEIESQSALDRRIRTNATFG